MQPLQRPWQRRRPSPRVPVTVGGVTVDPALLHMNIPDDEPMLDDVEVTEEEASVLESELVHPGMAPSPSSNPARVTELSSAHHGTAVAPAASAPRSRAIGPSHPVATPHVWQRCRYSGSR